MVPSLYHWITAFFNESDRLIGFSQLKGTIEDFST